MQFSDQPLPAASPEGDESGSSLGRAFEVLSLFGEASPLLRIEDITARLGYTRSTAYRYVRELCTAGLLAPRFGGSYSLGPRVVELERLVKLTDPLYRAGCVVLSPLRSQDSVYLLQELSGEDQVLCIYKEGPDELRYDGQAFVLKRERGLPFPLFRGAGSLALLAHLSPHRIRSAYLSGARQIAAAGLGNSWEEFRSAMTAIRRRGYAVSQGSTAPHVVGIAVPVLLASKRRVIGSLDQVIVRPTPDPAEERDIAEKLRGVAAAVAQEYERISYSPGIQ